jgi:hypothetical protein
MIRQHDRPRAYLSRQHFFLPISEKRRALVSSSTFRGVLEGMESSDRQA